MTRHPHFHLTMFGMFLLAVLGEMLSPGRFL